MVTNRLGVFHRIDCDDFHVTVSRNCQTAGRRHVKAERCSISVSTSPCAFLFWLWGHRCPLHRRSLKDLGFRPGFLIPLIAGTIFGIAIKAVWLGMLLLSADEYSFSNIVPTDLSMISYVLHYLYFLIGFITLNSFIEEFSIRAYPFENLRKKIHPAILAVASSLVFTAGHFFANEFSFPYALALMSAGLLYSCVYFQTGSIWAIVGVHNGANWFTYTFFGSSWKIGHVYETTISGTPQWIAEYSSCIAYLLAIGVVFTLSRLGVISCFFRITKIELSSDHSHQAS